MIHTESLVTNTIDSVKVRYCEASTLYKVYIKKSISSCYTNPVSLKKDLVSTNLKTS